MTSKGRIYKLLELHANRTRLTADSESARTSLVDSARLNQRQGVELQQALQAVAQHKAEADTLRTLVAQFQLQQPRPPRKKKGGFKSEAQHPGFQ